ncbi:hypothetical protein CHH27_03205 [Labrenzia sp. VG12]|nr:hypothetical protein CHH27_03205 [Labrenzia sp. VG12]
MLPSSNHPFRFSRLFCLTVSLVGAMIMSPGVQAGEALPYGPGVSKITIEDNRQDRPLAGDIWYPTSTPDIHPIANKSKVWQMAPADPDGPPAEGTFPLVVVSHGMYGNTFNQSWLGSELARRGYVVAMVNHPGTSSWLRDPDHTRKLWDRPVDLSRLISFLIEESPYRDRIDINRIHAVGHSLGGFTVMLLAGATFDQTRYETTCAGEDQPVACKVLTGWSIARTEADQAAMSVSRKDSRVKKIVSLDLGGTPVLSRPSLAALDIPVLVLGAERADMLDQDRESRALAASLPQDRVHHVELEGAGHFDFMGQCKPAGYAILKEHEPGDEIVCVKGSVERASQHRRILSEVLDFLTP